MIIKQIVDEDFTNYKVPSMHIVFGNCDWKCGKEFCHNKELADLPDITIDPFMVVKRYLENNITTSIIFNGLEPFDSFEHMIGFIKIFRQYAEDDIVIYTGYVETEIQEQINILKKFKNIIVKFGRYIPNQKPHYDEVLGVYLASDNQYGIKIS